MTATYGTDRGPEAGRHNPLVRATLRLERTVSLDAAAGALAPIAEALVKEPRRRDALQGRWLGHSIHPLIVTVPLGTWTGVSVLDVFGGRRGQDAARLLTGFGVLTALPSALTGLAEWADAGPRDRRTGTVHAGVNSLGLVTYAMSWRARRRGQHRQGACLAAVGYAVVSVGGYLGGHLTEARKVGSHHPAFATDDQAAPL